jgi:hypothetical protein
VAGTVPGAPVSADFTQVIAWHHVAGVPLS